MNTRLFLNKPLSFLIIVLLVVVLALTLSQGAAASTGCQPTVTVTSTGNSGPGTLRQAIVDVCEGGVIDFDLPLPNTINLNGELVVDKAMSINGPSADQLAVSANLNGRVLQNQADGLHLSGLTIRDGHFGFGGVGGGILNVGVMTVTDSVIRDNDISNILGGVSQGGGIANFFGTLVINRSTIAQNTVFGDPASSVLGGGVFNAIGTVVINNSTISENAASSWSGGGVSIGGTGATVIVNHSTIVNNHADNGGGVGIVIGGVLILRNSIIANNDESNCEGFGPIISLGHNLSNNNDCNLDGPGDLPNTDPHLGPLQDNGGTTPTHALLPLSPAIDAASPLRCPPTDQRGVPRPQGSHCDIGAYEREGLSE